VSVKQPKTKWVDTTLKPLNFERHIAVLATAYFAEIPNVTLKQAALLGDQLAADIVDTAGDDGWELLPSFANSRMLEFAQRYSGANKIYSAMVFAAYEPECLSRRRRDAFESDYEEFEA